MKNDAIRELVLSSIANDYESFEIIAHETGEWYGIGINHRELLETLAELIHQGLARAYVLSPHEPYAEYVEFSPERAKILWYLITEEGKLTLEKIEQQVSGHPLAIDPTAQSASTAEPAFIARPEGAPVYHGFPILKDVTVEGFSLGKISDFEAESMATGDAFVVAPDNSRAGLVWEVASESRLREVMGISPDRWGVWGVSFPHPMTNRDNARRNLECVLPQLKQEWERWRRQYQGL